VCGEVSPHTDSLGGILARADGNINQETGRLEKRFQIA